jgi:hypothetical protein
LTRGLCVDQGKITRFLHYARRSGFAHSTNVNYLSACSEALRYIAQRQLSMEERATLEQTREYFKLLRKVRNKARHKEVRARNSREAMEGDGTWLDLRVLGQIAAIVELEADAISSRCETALAEIDLEDAVRYRESLVLLLLAKYVNPESSWFSVFLHTGCP